MSEILEKMGSMKFQSLESAADFYESSPHVHPHNSKRESFKDGAEWQKEQLKAHIQKVIDTLENDFAKQLVANVTDILFS